MMRALARLAPATHWTSLVIPLSAAALVGRAKTWTPGASALPELDGLRRTLEDLDELRAALEASRAEILTALERNERGIAFEKLRTAREAAGEHIKRTRATLKRTFRD